MLAVGTLEPRKNLARVVEATALAGVAAARRRRARLGRRRRRGRRTSRWLGRVDDEELAAALPRRALPRLPLALRGLRHPGARGDGLRHARRDERGQRDGRGRRRRGRARRPARRRARSRPGSRRPTGAATSSCRSGSSGRGATPGSAAVEAAVAGYRQALAMTCRSSSSTPTCSAAAAPATRRTSLNLLRELGAARARRRPALRRGDAPTRSSCRPASSRSRCARRCRSCGWPGRCRGCCAGSARRSSTPVRAARSRSPVPGRRDDPRPLLRARSGADGLRRTGSSSGASCPRAARAAARVLTVSERTRARPRRALRRSPDEKVVVTPNGVDPAFSPGAAG